MIRELLAAAFLLIIGYVTGVFFGYKAAVVDYIENDANTIESMAEDLYQNLEVVEEDEYQKEEVIQADEEVSDSTDGGSAFH